MRRKVNGMIDKVSNQSIEEYYYKKHALAKSTQEKVNETVDTRVQSGTEDTKVDKDSLQNSVTSSYKQLSSQSEQLRSLLEEQYVQLEERIKNGEEEPSIQIGAKSMTKKEWEGLMNKVDCAIKEIKEQNKQEEKRKLDKKEKDRQQEKNRLEKMFEEEKLEKKEKNK